MSGKWTPGPWTACAGAPEMKQQAGDCTCGQVFAGGDKHIATTHAKTQDSDRTVYAEWSQEERSANSRLIAAAPDLAEALEDMLAGWLYIRRNHGDLYGVGWDRAQQRAEAALARVRGGQG